MLMEVEEKLSQGKNMIKTYTVIAPNGTRYPATKYQVASQLANDIAKLMGSAEIEIKLTKEVENETN